MRVATFTFALVALATAACRQQDQSGQNIAVDNNNMANADIEALPPDESSATPTNELENGAANTDAGELDNTGNSY